MAWCPVADPGRSIKGEKCGENIVNAPKKKMLKARKKNKCLPCPRDIQVLGKMKEKGGRVKVRS